MAEPMIKLSENGKATEISYNVPEPTTYPGENIIELDFDKSYFTSEALEKPESEKIELISEGGITKIGITSPFSKSKLKKSISKTIAKKTTTSSSPAKKAVAAKKTTSSTSRTISSKKKTTASRTISSRRTSR